MYIIHMLILFFYYIGRVSAADESSSFLERSEVNLEENKRNVDAEQLNLIEEKVKKDKLALVRASLFFPASAPREYYTSLMELEALRKHYAGAYDLETEFIYTLHLFKQHRLEEGKRQYNQLWKIAHDDPIVFSFTKGIGLIPEDTKEYDFDEHPSSLNWDDFNFDAVVNGTFDEEEFLRRYPRCK
ncbi:MAG: hypothetical protein Q8Q56_05840 [Alphaproteobacteria bacterium]|nr:hypothetical protein [Alphaproteobacteria bacterium]